MHPLTPLAETYEQIIGNQEPNFLRLYLNPHIAQTCFCLDRYVRTTWPQPEGLKRGKRERGEDCQSFLANAFDEALGGAIKLARYSRGAGASRSTGVILDPADRLTGFAFAALSQGRKAEFLPGLRVFGSSELGRASTAIYGDNAGLDFRAGHPGDAVTLLVLASGADHLLDQHAEAIRLLVRRNSPFVITCIDRQGLSALHKNSNSFLREIVPDIVVFDESFVDHAVPFGAFTARKSVCACWNRPGKATFHSTTFQPNSISTLQFMRCLATADPDFHARYQGLFQRSITDVSFRGNWFRRFYNPVLFRLIRATGFDTVEVRASGSFVRVNGRAIFDAVSGVACSFRGHNPADYLLELRTLGSVANERAAGDSTSSRASLHDELARRLQDLTGLEHFLPAVSGATAVENGLKLALVAQFPRRRVLALKGGFGGKTLFALTGTANRSYKQRLDPLYGDVEYVDAFGRDAEEKIASLLETGEFAIVSVELVQGVGGVRRVPENVIRRLDEGRERWDYLLLVDEVQTGMYRTGSFSVSETMGLAPDILLLGKATTDMMFPFALSLYSAKVQDLLKRQRTDLADSIRRRYEYDQGYKTVLNVLRLAEKMDMARRVAGAAALFAELLDNGFRASKVVRDIRVHGLLIGIELDTRRWPRRWLHKRLASFYLLSMLRHAQFPLLAGFCQYEPNVLKITPPLNTTADEIRHACDTIVEVLNRSLGSVLGAGLSGLVKSTSAGRKFHEHPSDAALEPVAR
jgi:acetylornithine/succinyldiaminopimelate/putrescine aminotransferase